MKFDKTSIEMLVCAIMIKCKYQHSTLYNVTPHNVMKFFGVSKKKKAERLIKSFAESELFVWNAEKRILYAKSFKSKEKIIYGKNGKNKYEAFADFCRKMQMQEDIKLFSAVQELRNILILNVINAVERFSGSNLKSIKVLQPVTEPLKSSAIPQRVIGKAMGMSRSSAGRYLAKLENDGRVSKTKMVAECVIPVLNETTQKAWRAKHPKRQFYVWHSTEYGGWSGWVMYGYAYSISNRKDSDLFQHVIWNYDNSRRGVNQAKPVYSCELDGKWA